MPKVNVHARIDHVLGHAVKLIVRRYRLNDTPFVLQAVVTKRGGVIKLTQNGGATSRYEQTNPAQNQRPSSDRWTEFPIFACTVLPWLKNEMRREAFVRK
jgi:hypothetical protein